MLPVTLLPLLVHVMMATAVDCCLERAMPVGLRFLVSPSCRALPPHRQGWVLPPPPFRSAAHETTYAFCCSAQNPQKEMRSPIWAQPARPGWALILLETSPFCTGTFPTSRFCSAGRSRCQCPPKQCPHSLSTGPQVSCKLLPREGKLLPQQEGMAAVTRRGTGEGEQQGPKTTETHISS